MKATRPKWVRPLAIYLMLDIFCVGAGMGVPFFSILFGFAVGFYIARMVCGESQDTKQVLQKVLLYATVTSAVTLLGMLIIWGRMVGMLWDPTADLANTGIPMILYEPRASFIGWLVLMILISPFLQLLTTLFSAHVTWLWMLRRQAQGGDA